MAHGLVNKTFYLSINNKPNLTYKVKQTDYDLVKSEDNTIVKVLVSGSKTVYTVIVQTAPDDVQIGVELESMGYQFSKGRTYVKIQPSEVVFDE